ncbi:MAG: hypothetical protein JXQ96_06740 [Cyclobacteriaceae bacterium]
MKRRQFVNLTTSTALAGVLASAVPGYARNVFPAEYDKYGGWTGKKFKATGFFRVEKDQRWWIVTPEGNAFLSFGINHLYPDLFKGEHNFQEWQKRLNLKDIQDYNKFQPALRKWFLQTCQDFGFNTIGCHNNLAITNNPKPQIAYVQKITFVDIPHWRSEVPDENFVDVFSEDFASHCKALSEKIVQKVKDDPFLLGYFMTDCPLFTEEDCRERPDIIGGAPRKSRVGWPNRLRNLGAEAPGKQAYVKVMTKLYDGQIIRFNETYDSSFSSFEDLLNAKEWRSKSDLSNANERRDNIEFLKAVVDKYYQVSLNAIREFDKNHMFIGDKLNANTDSIDTILPTTSKHTDIIMYQMYGRYDVQETGLDRWKNVVDKPFINGDSAFTMITEDMPRPYGPVADNLEQRAEWTKEFMENAFRRPEFVGWHYCGLIDATNKLARKRNRQHSGLLDQYGKPYPLLQKEISQFTSKMYEVANGK